MSGYTGRPRGVNVSQYIANLNTVPSTEDIFESPTTTEDDALALFTNGDFVDWDGSVGGFDQHNSAHFDSTMNFEPPTNASVTSEPKLDFNLNGNFDFADYNFPAAIADTSLTSMPHSNAYSIAPTFASPGNAAVSPVTPGGFDPSGKKRKLSSMEPEGQHSLDEAARHVAEEDKRRRNTAASARFRIKKKQREQALEKTAKEMSDRVSILETRIQQLETENTWLKSLITEKNGGKSSSDISAMLKKHEEGERISGSRNDGVGTKAEDAKA